MIGDMDMEEQDIFDMHIYNRVARVEEKVRRLLLNLRRKSYYSCFDNSFVVVDRLTEIY